MSGGCPDNPKMRSQNSSKGSERHCDARIYKFANIFAATGSLAPRRPMRDLPTPYHYMSGRFQNSRPVPWRRTRTPRSVFPPRSDVFHLLLGVAVAPDSQIARLEPPRRIK